MKNMSQVQRLCKEFTSLSEEDILEIKKVAGQLQLMADLTGTNVFIDCLVKNTSHAIVVAEASPSSGETLYNKPYVGTIVYEEFEPSVFLSFRTGKRLFFNKAVTQHGQLVLQSVIPIKNRSNQVIATLIKEELDHEAKAMNEMKSRAATSEEMLRELFFGTAYGRPALYDILKEHFILVDASLQIVYANPSAQNFFLEIMEVEDCLGRPVDQVMPFISHIIESKKDLIIEEIEVFKSFLEVKKVDIYQDHHMTGMLILLRDVTDLRMKERELILKSVAIQEIHHRVKNNLQAIASLLSLQIRKGVSKESKGYLVESLNRVMSIAAVYELILASDNVDEDQVDIVSLSNKIAKMLIQNNEAESFITFNSDTESIFANSKKAVSIALVVNELVQNSIKHAFRGRQSGLIEVRFDRFHNDVFLTVSDDGIGMKSDIQRSLGLDIVKMVIEHDLDGKHTIQSSARGTIVTISFSLERGDVGPDE